MSAEESTLLFYMWNDDIVARKQSPYNKENNNRLPTQQTQDVESILV